MPRLRLTCPREVYAPAAAAELGGQHAIKHVHAAMNGFEHIERSAHAHEVARPILRQKARGEFARILALGLPFTHGQSADREAVERKLSQHLGALAVSVHEKAPPCTIPKSD